MISQSSRLQTDSYGRGVVRCFFFGLENRRLLDMLNSSGGLKKGTPSAPIDLVAMLVLVLFVIGVKLG